jgi:hypothetical protein
LKHRKIRIGWLMFVVALVALDFGLGRALMEPPRFGMPLTELLVIGALPMANILACAIALLFADCHEPASQLDFPTHGERFEKSVSSP